MYEKYAAASVGADQKKVFTEPARTETGYKARPEGIYTSTAFAEAW